MTTGRRSAFVHLPATAIMLLCAAVAAAENAANRPNETGQLVVCLEDETTSEPLPGIIRISREDGGKPVRIPQLIARENGWYTIVNNAPVTVPAARLRIEALRGLQTELATAQVDVTSDLTHRVTLKLKRFYNTRQRGWRNGNTHLHLMKRSRIEAERYLREVPVSDGLELVYLSHLRRIPDESRYISNELVEQTLNDNILDRLSSADVLLRPGEEHRHNFGRGGEGFGHVMLLDITKLIRPVSIGPGIMRDGTDSQPLQTGIQEARTDGATVIWCHNTFGFEDIPNWMGGYLDAQNIFDGGSRGSYDNSFYRYLNLGMKIPFSTGTDWFIEDFSRVYVPIEGDLTSEIWLKQLKAGRSFITNGPLLEFTVDQHVAGDVLQLSRPRELTIAMRAVGRCDFGRMELIRNGEVIRSATTKPAGGHHVAHWRGPVLIDEPCWLAVRTAVDAPVNEFDKPLYSHSSPVYVDLNGRQPFRPEVALSLIQEIEESLQKIRVQAAFANDSELDRVMRVYREGIRVLNERIKHHQQIDE